MLMMIAVRILPVQQGVRQKHEETEEVDTLAEAVELASAAGRATQRVASLNADVSQGIAGARAESC